MLGTWGVRQHGPSCKPGLGITHSVPGPSIPPDSHRGRESGPLPREGSLPAFGRARGLSAPLCRGRSCPESKIQGSASLGDGSSPVRNTEPVQGQGKRLDPRAVPELSRLRSGPCSSRSAGAPGAVGSVGLCLRSPPGLGCNSRACGAAAERLFVCPGTTRRFALQPNAVNGFCRLPNRQLPEDLASAPRSQSVSPLPSASHPSCKARSQPVLWQRGSFSCFLSSGAIPLCLGKSLSRWPPCLENPSRPRRAGEPAAALHPGWGSWLSPSRLPALGEQTDPEPPFPSPAPARVRPISFLSQRQVFLPHRVFPLRVTEAWWMWVTIRHFISKGREPICLQEESVLPLRGAAPGSDPFPEPGSDGRRGRRCAETWLWRNVSLWDLGVIKTCLACCFMAEACGRQPRCGGGRQGWVVGFQRALGSSDPHHSAMQELWHRSPFLELSVSPRFSWAWALPSEKERSCAVQTTQVPSAGNDSLGCSEAGANDVTWVCALRWGRLGRCREDGGEVLAPSRRLVWCEEAPVPLLRLRRLAGLVPRASQEHHEIPAAVLGTHTIYFFI